MHIEYLVIGQGISGTFLSYYLQKENKSFLVIDNGFNNAASRIAAGIINPVTGRRLVTVWMADEVLPFAWTAYNEIGDSLGIKAISQKSIIDLFPNPFMREGFLKRLQEDDQYIHSYPDEKKFASYFNYEFGCGEISPAYMAHIETLLPAWRKQLRQNNQLLEEEFDINLLHVSEDKISYKDITAEKIIFCDGVTGAENPFFKQLPYAPNKGEALIVDIPELPADHIYKKSMTLVPLQTMAGNHFWIGSVYHWEFDDPYPAEAFRKNTEQVLKEWLKLPFKILDHRAGIRPATLERRPFVGLHPIHKNIGILNGMGTKGCSLAPFFAKQLTAHLLHDQPIIAEADVKRFSRILSR
ncbi:MAG TPA: FAD-binding oxidoreductase [Chitinophagaceae bacterium]